ncbi:Uncharacterized protein conserved in bacteria [Streptobacillus moniliformis]|nr:Uncharacterized protein conserved in bacteria [Streptobacillus moniliformis]
MLKKELDKKENLIEISDYFKDKVLFDLKIVDFEEIDTVEPEIISILYKMITALKEEVYSKNRENHLHHSLDAFLLTIMNRSMQMKLIKYNQLISVLKNKEIEIFNEEKGEYIDSKEFAEELQKQKIIDIDGNERGIKFNVNGKTHRLNLVKPYENFLDDIKIKF